MKNRITYGECLKFLLQTLDISCSKLSKAINVDSSLISRWINEKRIPSYESSYIDNIAEYLSKNVLNTLQEKLLCDFFSYFITEDNSTSNNKEKIRNVLLEAQGYSIEIKKLEKKEVTIRRDIEKRNVNTQVQVMNYKSTNQGTLLINSIDLSCNDKIIFGTRNILISVTKMLKKAAYIEANNNETIYLTFNNDFYESFKKNILYLESLLLNVIDKNWKVCFIIRINQNLKLIKDFIKFIIPHIRTGKIFVFFHSKYELFDSDREICLISKIGLLSCFHSKPSSCTDFAIYIQNNAIIDLFEKYIESLIICSELKPITFYFESKINEFYNALTVSIEKKGAQFNYNYILSMLLLPKQLYNKLLNKISIPDYSRSSSLKYYSRQLETFYTNLQYYKYRDIYFAEKIEEMIITQSIDFYSLSGIEKVKVDVNDMKEYLNNIIHIIQTYDNYEVAVIYKDSETILTNNMYNCNIKGRYAAFYTFFTPQHKNPSVCLSIEEPTVIKAITENYNESWEGLSPMNRDKDETIGWLRSCLDMID